MIYGSTARTGLYRQAHPRVSVHPPLSASRQRTRRPRAQVIERAARIHQSCKAFHHDHSPLAVVHTQKPACFGSTAVGSTVAGGLAGGFPGITAEAEGSTAFRFTCSSSRDITKRAPSSAAVKLASRQVARPSSRLIKRLRRAHLLAPFTRDYNRSCVCRCQVISRID